MEPKRIQEIEQEIRAFWERERIFGKSVERDAPNGEFVFYDGPPTANAPPGIHHAESQMFKDVIPRYKTMRGYRVRRKAGWDTHGLPVELQIEKKLGLKTKKDIEAYGVARFNAECRDSVWEFKGAWEDLKHRMGSWMDMRNPYVTYEMPFIESVWWFLKQAWEKGLLVRDYKIVPWCPRCETPLSSHEVALGYKDDAPDPSVYVRFVLTAESAAHLRVPEGSAFLVWTTTPWTLPGNGALAVHPGAEYAVVGLPENTERAPESPSAGSETHGTRDGQSPNSKHTIQFSSYLILAKPLVERVLGQGVIVERLISGKELVGLRYQPLYPRIDTAAYPEAYQTLDAAFVSFEDGTGIVHIAPAYGEDDFAFKRRGIPPTFSVSDKGIMSDGLPGAGKFAKEADGDIRADLRNRKLLFRDEEIRHTYPFCWRCDTPLLYYARASWYIAMSKLRAEIQAKNQTIHWLPEHIRDGRFGEWLRELKDWAITRERYWGAPMPIWECDRCQQREIIDSFADLIAKAPKRNRFILMRHGEARSNVEVRINSKQETSDQWPLIPEGRSRVERAAEQLRSSGVTKILASPFHRMRQTAEIVSRAVGVPITYDERLREFDIPDFDGKTTAEHRAVFPTTLDMFLKKIGSNETWGDLAQRMLRTLKSIDEQHEGETILICSHGDPLFLLRWAYSGRTREGIEGMPYPDFDNPTEFAFTGSLVNDRGELDAHRPFIDGVTWPCTKDGCGGTMRRFPEVVDVWLESGCMPFAQVHFPFEQENGISNFKFQISNPPALYPADYISEAIDQTRGWFYTLLAVATVLGWDAPYKNVIVLGHLLDKSGQKMSKSKGNVVDPIAMIDRYGADVVRWYMVAVNQPWDAKLFNEAELKLMSRKPFGTLMNLLSFWQLHGGETQPRWPEARGETSGVDRKTPDVEERAGSLLDSWLRARTAAVHAEVTAHLDAYELTEAARAINDLVDDISTWWLRRSRERLKEGDAGARGIFTATLQSLAVLLAPFAPFHAEQFWKTSSLRGAEGDEAISSVHLVAWDTAAPPIDENDAILLQQMIEVRRLCSLGLEARAKAGIPVRQPLAKLSVPRFSPSPRGGARGGVDVVSEALLQLIADEVNVREVRVDPSLKDAVALDTALTPELKREGLVRELTRTVNNLRKEMGLTPSDRIRVTYETDDAELAQAIAEQQVQIERATVASQWSERGAGGKTSGVDRKTPDVEEPAHHTLRIASVQITLDIAVETHR